MKIIIPLLLVSAVVSGCSTYYRNVNNPSWGQAEFDRDEYFCKRENTTVGGSYVPGVGAIAGPTTDMSMVSKCMSIKGWREVN